MKTWIENNAIKVFALLLLLGALMNPTQVAYYQLMNWVVLGSSIVSAWQAHKRGWWLVMWLFALIGVVFNPLAPIFLAQNVWPYVDIVVAGIFLISLWFLGRENKQSAL
jgi:hypothetical protein